MSGKRLRLMVLTHGSDKAAAIIERLLRLPCAEVGGIFVETEITRRHNLPEKLRRSVRYDGVGGTLLKLANRLLKPVAVGSRGSSSPAPRNREHLREMAAAHGVPLHLVPNFNLPDSLALMRAARADLGVVLGTNILKEVVFSIPRLGSINLHQGLAPYYRGGPPVFWELFNGEPSVGLTVHFVAAKVDTGDIVAQESLPLVYDYAHGLDYESFINEYREKLHSRAAELVPRAVRLIAEGTATPIAQNVELGTRYRLPVKREKDELRRRLRERQGAAGARAAATNTGVSNR